MAQYGVSIDNVIRLCYKMLTHVPCKHQLPAKVTEMSKPSQDKTGLMFPIITGPIADSWMIQRGGPEQTGQKDAQWLTPDRRWSRNIFMGAGFEPGQYSLASSYLRDAQARNLPVLTHDEEMARA
ncbi:hypothetical protein CL628_00245 [bacterium]|nr:hypothetical protein [bacterium]